MLSNPGQLDTGQLDIGQLDTHESDKVCQLDTLTYFTLKSEKNLKKENGSISGKRKR